MYVHIYVEDGNQLWLSHVATVCPPTLTRLRPLSGVFGLNCYWSMFGGLSWLFSTALSLLLTASTPGMSLELQETKSSNLVP